MVYLILAIIVVLIGVGVYLVNRKPKNLPRSKGGGGFGGGFIEDPTYPGNEVIKEEQSL